MEKLRSAQSGSKKSGKVHPIVWLNYYPRISGHILATAIIISAFLKHNVPNALFIYLVLQGLIWPHIALWSSYNSKNPKVTEKYLLRGDHFLTGCWVAAVGYEPWVAIMLIAMGLMGSMAISGVRAYLTGMAYSALGAGLTSYFYVFYFQPESSMLTIVLCMIGILIFTAVISYLTFARSSELMSIRKEQSQLNDRLSRMNELVKTASMSLKLSEMIDKIYPEAKALLGFDSYFVLKFQMNSDVLKIYKMASDHIDRTTYQKLLELETRPFEENSFVAKVIKNKEIVYIQNMDNQGELSEFDRAWNEIAPYKSQFLIPILNENLVSGVIICQRHKEGFSFGEKEMIEIIRYADQMSLMFNNALLYDESQTAQALVKRKNENLEQANEEIQLQRDQVIKTRDELANSLDKLQATQTQLIQQEKLASLGQLTAGIAHEIKNPLNFVNNFSQLNIEMIEELKEEFENLRSLQLAISLDAEKQSTLNSTSQNIVEILDDIEANLKSILKHGTRADTIVKSMLLHSREGSREFIQTDLNELIKEYVNLSFHGMRAGKRPINVDIQLELDETVGSIPLISEDFSRVILNLCNNAFDAMREKFVASAESTSKYLPRLKVCTLKTEDHIRISFEDNGPGIPDELKEKILQPFFTTKKGIEGTGLGLSITHDIVKAHGGELKIGSTSANGATFILQLPRSALA